MSHRFLISEEEGGVVARFVDGNDVLFTSKRFASKVEARQAVHALQAQAAPAEIKDED